MSVIIVTPPSDEDSLQTRQMLTQHVQRHRPGSCRSPRLQSTSLETESDDEHQLLLRSSTSFTEPYSSRRSCRSARTVRPRPQRPVFYSKPAQLNRIGSASVRRAKFQFGDHRQMLSPTTQYGKRCHNNLNNNSAVAPNSYAALTSFPPQHSFDSACSEVPQLTRRRSSESDGAVQPVRFSYSAENLHPGEPPYASGGNRVLSPRHKRIAWDNSTLGGPIKDISGITTDYMRVNGAIQQFRTLLGSVREKPGLTPIESRLNAQNTAAGHASSLSIRKNEDFGSQLVSVRSEHPKSIHDSTSIATAADLATNHVQEPGNGDSQTHEGSMSHPRIKLNIGYRLGRRREIFDKRRKASDYGLIFALLGIALMVIENELAGIKVYDKDSIYSFALKTLIVISTLALLCFIVSYHTLEVQLFLIDNSAEDWRIVLTPRRVTQLSLELLVCMICPIPGDYTFQWSTIHSDGKTQSTSAVSIDVLLSIPMFLRLYLIARVMLLHSRLFTDASSRSIGALNRINFNTRFVMKTLMTLSPGTVLIVLIGSFWIIAAWILRLCERHHSIDIHGRNITGAQMHEDYLNSIWLIAITFLSVGYGDIVPNTICGRTVAVITGIMGAGTSSLVVAVLAKKLEFSRAEKHVHNFMMDTQLTKRLKHAAANVLRETWLIYKNRRKMEKVDASKVRYHQRKFLMAIYELRRVKAGQRKLSENSHTVADIARTSTTTYEIVADMQSWGESLETRIARLEEQVDAIGNQMTLLPDLIAQRLLQPVSLVPQQKTSSPSISLKPPDTDG